MRWLPLVMPVVLALSCTVETRPPSSPQELGRTPADNWEAVVRLPLAAQACRDAGYPVAEVARFIEAADEAQVPLPVVAEALAITATAAREHGPIGELSDYLFDAVYRYGLRGEVLRRTIVVEHAVHGYRRLNLPNRQEQPTSADQPAGAQPDGGA